MYRISLLVFLVLAVAPQAYAADTLKFYNLKSKLVYYRDPGITAQATRFEAPKPLDITGIIITLGGDSARGGISLRVFGGEGGLPVPLLQRDLAPPIRISKSRPGVERIIIRLDDPIHVDASQFFLVVDSISRGTLLLSDNQRKRPACTNGIEEFHHQFLKLRDGSWRSGVFAFAVEAIVEYTVKDPKGGFKDVTAEIKVDDSLRFNASIAWADIDNDARLDLLVDGRLYHNDADGSFRQITEQAGISGAPLANAFIDADNDARPDILFLGSADDAQPASLLYRNNGDQTFTRRELAIPHLANPTSFSIADADADGDLDLFVGQQSVRLSDTLRNYLLINERGRGFIDRSRMLYGDSLVRATSRGSQWIDYDGDGRLDLFVAGYDGSDELWRSTGDTSYALVDLGMRGSLAGARRAGCDWADYDNDGDPDLLLPSSISPAKLMAAAERGSDRRSVSLIMDNGGAPDHAMEDRGAGTGIEYVDRHSGGTWGDVDNDGLLDAIITTGCDCRYVGLYRQRPDHRFEDRTTESGLRSVVAGPDAVWADWDNDGRLDLATVSNGRLRLYRNLGVGESGNWVELDVSGQSVGSTVTVHTGDGKYTRQVTNGRGLLMGPPLRLHFGIANASHIDSVIVTSPETGRAQSFADIPVNTVSRLAPSMRQSISASTTPTISARPNPFRTSIELTYDLPAAGHVRLAIYSSIGTLINVLADEVQSAGHHSVRWNAVDDDGRKQPHGTYIYRLTTPSGEIEERIIRVD